MEIDRRMFCKLLFFSSISFVAGCFYRGGNSARREADGARREADGARREADGARREADGARREADGSRSFVSYSQSDESSSDFTTGYPGKVVSLDRSAILRIGIWAG